MNLMSAFSFLILSGLSTNLALANKGPLFQTGAETFTVLDSKGKAPVFKILKDSVTKQTLAIAINTALNLSSSKSNPEPQVELKIEKMSLRPIKDKPEKISLFLFASGREFELDSILSKSDLMSEKTISIVIPAKTNEFALFSVVSKGKMVLKFNKATNELLIQQALLQLQIESPMSDDEFEKMEFSGKGIRL